MEFTRDYFYYENVAISYEDIGFLSEIEHGHGMGIFRIHSKEGSHLLTIVFDQKSADFYYKALLNRIKPGITVKGETCKWLVCM